MVIDLDRASTALHSLRTDQGRKVLDELDAQLEQFRKQLGVDLNDAEFRYVMETLFQQRTVTTRAPVTLHTVAHGFAIRDAI